MAVQDEAAATAAAALESTDTGAALDAADQRALTRVKPALRGAELAEMMEYGEVVARSQFFGDMATTAKAVIKLSIGRELGLSRTASLTGVHIFQTSEGTRVIIAGQLLLAKVNAHPDYRLEIVRSDRQACYLMPWKKGGLFGKGEDFQRIAPACFAPGCEGGKIKGARCAECAGSGHVPVKFTIDDAKTLGLLEKKNWKGDPESMCLWRCVAKAQRRYFPDLLAIGQAYLDDEFDEFQIPAAVGALEASPKVTVQRPRRASAPPPDAIDAQPGTFATTVVGDDGLTEAERSAGEPPRIAPEDPVVVKCDGNHGGAECDDRECWLREPHRSDAPPRATPPKKHCPKKGHGEFTGLFCPDCMQEPV